MKTTVLSAACTLALGAASAHAGYAFTQSGTQTTTYGTQLNFDEAGGPTGTVAANAWQALYGVSIYDGGSGTSAFVDNISGTLPWVNNNNTLSGTYGIFLDFDTACDGLSFEAWDDSGPPTFFGGGLFVYVLNAQGDIVDGAVFTPAWGGLGETWFNITATGGDTFNRILITGNSFFPTTVVDNLSWNTVPGPGALALLPFFLSRRAKRRA